MSALERDGCLNEVSADLASKRTVDLAQTRRGWWKIGWVGDILVGEEGGNIAGDAVGGQHISD